MLVDYSSSDEETEDGNEQKSTESTNTKDLRPNKLPSAVELLGNITKSAHEDIPEEHDGRIRSFAHERGIWATFCYIPFDLSESIQHLQKSIKNSVRKNLNLELCEAQELHVSLTKTVILRHHWIESFVASLEKKFRNIRKFPLHLNSLKIYCNEEKTRTFVGLTSSEEFFAYLSKLVKHCDEVLKEFNLECFYREMSFHVSILWIVGDHRETLCELEEDFREHFLDVLGENFPDFSTQVEKIHCKSGNKLHTFTLK
ncbi:U6 snRNA phosphodiesterase 1 [Phlebotomus papatasi]|uniref:U6 snRNA phosphodiesterase 1 n=1 Tax=Phlebotomus papatasi TaxID=29031 RepID=UPI0024846855|nr:U6 snRNA phosphodiesterase 1 [Phlebotomus papatasi]